MLLVATATECGEGLQMHYLTDLKYSAPRISFFGFSPFGRAKDRSKKLLVVVVNQFLVFS
jgi:hypothetical protein